MRYTWFVYSGDIPYSSYCGVKDSFKAMTLFKSTYTYQQAVDNNLLLCKVLKSGDKIFDCVAEFTPDEIYAN